MRFFIITLLFFAIDSTTAVAEVYGFAGCGAGTRIFGPRSMQTSASTTNHGFIPPLVQGVPFVVPSSQPWSITLDIAGCGEKAKPVAYFEQYDYMFANFATLSKELAQGTGESVSGLASAFGCNKDVNPEFATFLKGKYHTIFSQPGIRAAFLEIRKQVASSAILVEECSGISDQNSKVQIAANQAEGGMGR